ncbi:MAG: glycoside hydrolase family 9 protein [Cytophagaceae bacterium]|nr:glycoside hydrolase family 9 protein [Cytophagaceae bacterium]
MKSLLAFNLVVLALYGSATQARDTQSWIRINQLGYLQKSVKVAVFVSKDAKLLSQFELCDAQTNRVVFTSERVRNYGPYAAFRASARLDFSGFQKPGQYYLRAGTVQSPNFRIANDVYDGTADFALKYMRQQRSNYNPFLKDTCHRDDGFIVYHPDPAKDSTRIDASGGWHDASDYLQYLPTSANAVYQMLFAYQQNPGSFGDGHDKWGNPGANGIADVLDEAKWGLDWLLKMNPAKGELYNQIADDRDHAGMRLPTLDTVRYGPARLGFARPVYFVTGQPQGAFTYKNRTKGVASTAGKFASAFALGSRILQKYDPDYARKLVQKAVDAYAFGRQFPGATQTAPGRAPYFYEEDNDADDMELAAAELHRINGSNTLLQQAIAYARAEPTTPWMGADTARHYQWYPFVNMGHLVLAAGKTEASREARTFLRLGIEKVVKRGAGNPFLNGVPFIWCSNNLTVNLLTQMHQYRKLTSDRQFEQAEASLRDWLFGCNPWGTSMVVGLPKAGISPRDPHSAFTHLYNYPIDGGLVDGPVYGSIWKSLLGITLYSPDEFAEFQSNVAVYHDDYGDYSTNEPTMDGTACLSYILSALQQEGAGNQ